MVKIQLWDVSGTAFHSKMISNYVHEANAILITYDVTHSGSFHNAEEWLKVIHSMFLGTTEAVGMNAMMVNPLSARQKQAQTDQNQRLLKLPYLGLVGNKGTLLNFFLRLIWKTVR